MSPHQFQVELTKIAPDLRLLYLPEDKRYWVIQQRAAYSGLVMPDGATSEAFYRVFPINPKKEGEFAYPDESHLRMAVTAVIEGNKMWKDCHAYMRNLKDKEDKLAATQKANNLALIEEATKEFKNSQKIKIYTGR